MLCSIITPTRKRLMRLIKTMDSIYENADKPTEIEAVLKIDEDDAETLLGFPWQHYPNVKKVVTPRGRGYVDMGRFVTEACNAATGKWCFLIDDDAWIVGRGWDAQLRQVTTPNTVCQCEFYHLGASEYGSGSCGPNGLIFPNGCWKQFGISELSSPADQCLKGLLVDQHHWRVHLLRGVTYRHNRDTEEQLAAQALL